MVTKEMICAAHDICLKKGDFVLSASLLERIYLAMRDKADGRDSAGWDAYEDLRKASDEMVLNLRQRVQELEKQRDELLEQVECSNITEKNMEGRLNKLIVQNAATKDRLDEHRDGRLSALEKLAVAEKQRDELLAELERFMDSHEECTDFDGFTAQIVSMADYHQAQEAIASVKEKK